MIDDECCFYAHGPGVVVPHPHESLGFYELHKDWCAKRKWCDEQGWELSKDYLVSAVMVNARWCFKQAEDQLLFALRWL